MALTKGQELYRGYVSVRKIMEEIKRNGWARVRAWAEITQEDVRE